MAITPSPRPLVVIIIDGWGISFVQEGNAILAAHTPAMDSYIRLYPSAAVGAASVEVGLPWGEVGNSETGHRNIGAGSVQYQALPAIDRAIEDGRFASNEALLGAIHHAKENSSKLHLMGLVSTGGVHSHMNHLFELLRLCAKQNMQDQVFIHMFTDGRDAPPQSALTYLQALEEAIGKYGVGVIASVTGRFWAMDRNKNWERTEAAYSMLTGGSRRDGAPGARQAVTQAYAQNIFDEEIPPTAITRGGGPVAPINDNDAVIFFNFRPDRARQLTQAFVQPEETQMRASAPPSNLFFATLTRYDATIPAVAAFIEQPDEMPLAKVLSDANLTQLHIAETEKYAHVTYYLNVGNETPFRGEDDVLIPSSGITSFADDPRMQAGAITDRAIEEITAKAYDVYFINFANPDMVGHTGNFKATVEACAFVDMCIGRLEEAILAAGGALLITADHGNAEELLNPGSGASEKDHTSNPVPLFFIYGPMARTTPKSDSEIVSILSAPIGVLADVAPTVLDILNIEKPPTMTGVSLLSSLR